MPDGNEFSPQDIQDLQAIASKLPPGDPTRAKITSALVPHPSEEQAAAERLTGGLISPSGLAPMAMQLHNEPLAPLRKRDFSTGRPVESLVPRTGPGMEQSLAPHLVRGTLDTALPTLGAMGGTMVAAPTVAGAALGGGLGTAGGDQAAQWIERGIFGKDESGYGQPSPVSAKGLERTAIAGGLGAATGALTAGLSGAPLRMPKTAAGEINQIIGASPAQIRISKSAQDLGEATTNPERGLLKEGFQASDLSKMSPVERMAAIKPKYDAAGQAIDDMVSKATKAGNVVDVGKTATDTLGKIADPTLQQRAIDSFNNLAKELGIQNLRTATPEEALALRRALGSKARFGMNGDLSSLGGVRAGLYRSVNSDLRAVVPDLQPLDQHFSDLNAAIEAAQKQVGKTAVKGPPPSLGARVAKAAPGALIRGLELAGAGGGLGGAYALGKKLLNP